MTKEEATDLQDLNDDEEDEIEIFNGKKKKSGKKSGGFQSMDLSHSVLKGILKRGYKIPTPIQRKVRLSVYK